MTRRPESIVQEFKEKYLERRETIFFDGMWWQKDKAGIDTINRAEFRQKKVDYTGRMSRLLKEAGVNPEVIKPLVIMGAQVGLSKRAMFGLEFKVNRLNPKESRDNWIKLHSFLGREREQAKEIFEGYEFDDGKIDGVENFVDYMLIMM